MSNLLQAVCVALDALIASGALTVDTSGHDETAFGNGFVVLRGLNVRVRFIRDRSQLFVEVACLQIPDDWHSLQRLLAATGLPGPPEGPLDLDTAADLLVRHVQKIEAEICVQETHERLCHLGAAAKRDLLHRFKGGTN